MKQICISLIVFSALFVQSQNQTEVVRVTNGFERIEKRFKLDSTGIQMRVHSDSLYILTMGFYFKAVNVDDQFQIQILDSSNSQLKLSQTYSVEQGTESNLLIRIHENDKVSDWSQAFVSNYIQLFTELSPVHFKEAKWINIIVKSGENKNEKKFPVYN